MTGAPPRDVEPGEAPLLARWRDRSRCPDPTLLLPALAGTLPEPLKGVVATHLAECSICTELASALADAAMPTEQEVTRISERIDRSRRNHLLYRWTALAAAAVIVTVAGGAYVITRWERTVVPPVHSADAAPAPAPRDPVLALAAPAIELPPEFLTLRGDARDTYAAALERALEVFKRGDYRLAAARFERVVRAHPGRLHARFYLGTSLLLRGDPAAAIRPLERARQLAGPGDSLYSEATWYLAVALERSGRSAEAIDPLAQLCGERSPRGEQACEGLSRLLNR